MKFSIRGSLLFSSLLATGCDAFSTLGHHPGRSIPSPVALPTPAFSLSSRVGPRLKASAESEEAKDDEIERLRSMAAKLRAEAASLEAEQAQSMAEAAERAFRKFDTNQDGEISLAELKEGLEKEFKQELPEKRVKQLMEDFDKSGDGALQLDEFVGTSQFRNRLDALAREERALALEKVKQANAEEAAAKILEAQVAVINDKPPSTTDRFVSILPYLFPLLDGFQYAKYFVLDNQDNLLVLSGALMYALYRSIPFGGLIAFFVLFFFSGRPGINRLIRYNMQQAIFLDIALFFPGIFSVLVGMTGIPIPVEVAAISSNVVFFGMVATIVYVSGSSLLGITPDKVPFISEAVNQRVPTVDTILRSDEFQFMQPNGDNKRDGETPLNGESKSKEEEKEKVNKD